MGNVVEVFSEKRHRFLILFGFGECDCDMKGMRFCGRVYGAKL